jgi:hypothetical protein
MAASAWLVHDKVKEYVGEKVIDFNLDNFKINLYLVGSNVHTAATDALATATNQHATQFGYTQDTKAIAGQAWTEATGTVTFDCNDVQWIASGGSILARFAAIYDDDVASPVIDPIVCSTLLDDTPGDVEATDGNEFNIAMNASGVFTLS